MTEPQEVVALRVSVAIAVMSAAIAALREGAGGGVMWVVVLVAMPFAFLVGYLVRATRPVLLRAAQSVAAIGILVGFFAQLQHATDLAALQIPLSQAFLWLLVLHALDVPNRRGLMVLLVASLVLIALAGVLSISMAVAPWFAIWALAALVSLVLAYRSELEELPALDGRPAPRFSLEALLVPTALLLTVLLVGFGVFMLVPVAGTNRALTFPSSLPDDSPVRTDGALSNPALGGQDPGAASDPGHPSSNRASFGYFGFSNELDTAVRGRPDDTLVMRVRANAPDFWRGQTFDLWDGRIWRVGDDRPSTLSGDNPIGVPRVAVDGPPQLAADVDELVQTYYLERTGPNTIFAANEPNRVYFPDSTIFQNQDGTLRAGVRLDPGAVYTVVSHRPLVTESILRAPPPEPTPEPIMRQYAAPPTTTDRVRALARSITADAPTPYDKVRAIERYLATHTQYSLDIPPLPKGTDAVDQFLFVDRRGFCEQIGTTLVVMLRELGIPARLAVGYTPGERNPFTGLYEVKASDAHAWAEVYFPGVGWQGFDPTADVPLAGDSGIDAAGAGALAYLSARLDVPTPVLAALVIAGGLVGLFFALRSLTRRPRKVPISRSWASRHLARLERLGHRRGRPRAPAETTPAYTDALGALAPTRRHDLTRVARALDAAMFGPQPVDPAEATEIDALVASIEADWSEAANPADLIPG